MIKRLALLALGALVSATVPATSAFGQTTTYTVQMGAGVPHGFSTRAFAPLDHGVPTINIASGDIVNLVEGALLLPEGTGPLEWHAENTQEIDAPFGLLLSDPDPDLPGVNADYKFNVAAVDTPTDPDCGITADAPCDFDGSTLFNGGARFELSEDAAFYVRFTAPAGTTLWATSVFGVSRVASLRINIVETGVDTQAFVDEAAADLLARERDAAAALHAKLSKASTKHRVGGQTVWDAYAGYDTATFALIDFYPAKLNIKKGDKVRWHFSELNIEQHGLAFPFEKGIDIANNESFIPACDPDGDNGASADVVPNFETFSCDDPGAVLEFDVGRALLLESGDGRFPGGSERLENSGLRGPNIPSAPGIAGGLDPWDLTFTKVSGDKGYRYVCTFHGRFMNAAVVVK